MLVLSWMPLYLSLQPCHLKPWNVSSLRLYVRATIKVKTLTERWSIHCSSDIWFDVCHILDAVWQGPRNHCVISNYNLPHPNWYNRNYTSTLYFQVRNIQLLMINPAWIDPRKKKNSRDQIKGNSEAASICFC